MNVLIYVNELGSGDTKTLRYSCLQRAHNLMRHTYIKLCIRARLWGI